MAAPSLSTSPLDGVAVVVPVVTPLTPEGRPDLDSMRSLLDFVLAAGVDGVLALGSSGESVALSRADREAVGAAVVEHVGARTHVMLGLPTAGTADAQEEAVRLAALGPSSLLAAVPAGLRLSDAELRRHIEAIAAAGAPVVAYDVPGRAGWPMEIATVAALAADGTAVALKDSTGDIVKARRYVRALAGHSGFRMLTGCEEVIDGSLLAGYHGSVPGLANVFPRWHVALAQAAAAGRWERASALQAEIVELMDLYFQPIPGASFMASFLGTVKEALRQLGVIAHTTSCVPVTGIDEALSAHVSAVLARAEEMQAVLVDA